MADLYQATDSFQAAGGRFVRAGDLVEAGDPVMEGREHLFTKAAASPQSNTLPDVHPDERVPEYPHDDEPERTEDDVDSTKIGRTDEPFAGAGSDDSPDDAVGTVELNPDGTGRVGPDEAADESEHTEDQRLQEEHDGRPEPAARRRKR